MSVGIPKDELFIYEDALRQGHTVLIALTDDTEQYDATILMIMKTRPSVGAMNADENTARAWVSGGGKQH